MKTFFIIRSEELLKMSLLMLKIPDLILYNHRMAEIDKVNPTQRFRSNDNDVKT